MLTLSIPGVVACRTCSTAGTRELTTAFLRSVHHGDSDLRAWPMRHAAIVSRFVGPAYAGRRPRHDQGARSFGIELKRACASAVT